MQRKGDLKKAAIKLMQATIRAAHILPKVRHSDNFVRFMDSHFNDHYFHFTGGNICRQRGVKNVILKELSL
jgi:hypothetical protein